MKPGYKTTEFWLTFAAMLLSAVVASGLLDAIPGSVDDQIASLLVMVLSGLGYTAARGFAKSSEVRANAAVAIETAIAAADAVSKKNP